MFYDTHLFSPVVIDGLCKAHPKSMEFREWWEEQRQLCITGYTVNGVRITGEHYWYLNFWKIKGVNEETKRKDLIAPRFLDMDHEFFVALEKARSNEKNMCVVKRRQSGFSEKLASIAGREFSLFRNSQIVIIAGEEKYNQNTMRMTLRGLNSLKNTEFYKRRTPDTIDYVQARWKEIDEGIPTWKGSLSEIYSLTGKNNTQASIGKSPSLIIFEEGGRFPGLKESFNFIKPALETNFRKTGMAIIVGTGGDMAKGAAELSEIFYDPKSYDMMEFDNIYIEGDVFDMKKICYFVPAWKFSIIDKDGNSLFEPSMEKIKANRDNAMKAKDPVKFIQEQTQMPLTPDEAFMRTGGNCFNIAKLNEQLAKIRNYRELSAMGEKGRLEWVRDDRDKIVGVDWHPDMAGEFLIYEHPEKDSGGNVYINLYKGATDSYDKPTAFTSKSKGSCQIFKGFRDMDKSSRLFVARVTVRPDKPDDFYEMSAKLCFYYMAPNLIEWSNIGIFGWYERNGFEHFLRERPRIAYANIKTSKASNRYGIDPSTKSYWITAYRDYIEDNYQKMNDPEQIIAAINFINDKDYNCDITISSSLCIVHELDDRNLAVKQKSESKNDFFSYQSNNGRIQQSYSRARA